MKRNRATIRYISSYFPGKQLTNHQLAQEFGDWDEHKILEKTGIAVRRVAGADECASDLGVAAAKQLFERGGCKSEEIDFLLFCTQSPDYFLPTTACIMQEQLGLRNDCGAIDFNQGCSGFVYGLALAKSLIETHAAANVLLITAETYSKFINPKDRSVRTIFSDAAAATLIGSVERKSETIGPFIFGTDGSGAQNLIVPAGGMRRPRTAETSIEKTFEDGNCRSEENLFMNGPEIFNFTLKAVPHAVERLLEKSNREVEQVDYFIFHQANKFMLERLRRKLNLPADKFWLDMEHCGNTVSSTIPIALESAKMQGKIHEGDNIMLVGFGVGYSWAATMIQLA